MSTAAMKVPTEFTAVDKFTSVVKKMTTGVSRFAKNGAAAVKRFDTKVNSTIKNMSKISKLALGLGLAGLFTTAIQGNIAYNDSLASVSAITGAVGDDLIRLEKLSKNTAKQSKKTGADVLKAYELIGSAKPELLGNLEALDAVTASAITLSKASRLDLEPAALALTDVMNQFGKEGKESAKVIDILANGAKFGAAAIPLINEAILKFGPTAKSFNVSLEESVALVETFAAKGLKGAEAGTKMRNILTKMSTIKALPAEAQKQLAKFGVNTDKVSDSTIPLVERLKELQKIGGDATAMVKVFGAENKDAGTILLSNIDTYADLAEKMGENGTAAAQAATNSRTFQFAIDAIKASFINATTATNGNNGALSTLLDLLFFLGDNMETVVNIVAGAIITFAAFKAILWATRAAVFAHNIVLGINTAITQTNKKALVQNAVAQNAYKVAMAIGTGVTWLATAATTAFGVALNLGLWPILAIIAAIVAVIAIIKNWSSITEWFGKKWEQFTGWISGLWGKVVGFFKDFDFMAFFKRIGQSILSFMLLPMKGVLTLLSKIPGKVGELAQLGLDKIADITGEVTATTDDAPLDSPETEQANATREANANVNGQIDLNIKDPGSNVDDVDTSSSSIPIKVTPTQGGF